MRNQALLAILLIAAVAPVSRAAAPVKVHLEPIAEGVIEGLDPAKAEQVLRDRLARRRSIVLVPEANDATIVLRVSELASWGEKRHVLEQADRGARIPTEGRGIASGSEGYIGVRSERKAYVLIVVRASWKDHFEDLTSHDADHTLKAAADSIAKKLDRIAGRR